jgi:hypothetical protein
LNIPLQEFNRAARHLSNSWLSALTLHEVSINFSHIPNNINTRHKPMSMPIKISVSDSSKIFILYTSRQRCWPAIRGLPSPVRHEANIGEITDSFTFFLYRVSQEKRSILWEVTVPAILRKKVYMNTSHIPNGFRYLARSILNLARNTFLPSRPNGK